MARETTIRRDDLSDEDPDDEVGLRLPGASIPDSSDQPEFDDELRPSRLEDVVGQTAVVERIRILLEAARKRNEPLGHLLLDGPPGLGKTTLAMVIPKELGTDFQITADRRLARPKICCPI